MSEVMIKSGFVRTKLSDTVSYSYGTDVDKYEAMRRLVHMCDEELARYETDNTNERICACRRN